MVANMTDFPISSQPEWITLTEAILMLHFMGYHEGLPGRHDELRTEKRKVEYVQIFCKAEQDWLLKMCRAGLLTALTGTESEETFSTIQWSRACFRPSRTYQLFSVSILLGNHETIYNNVRFRRTDIEKAVVNWWQSLTRAEKGDREFLETERLMERGASEADTLRRILSSQGLNDPIKIRDELPRIRQRVNSRRLKARKQEP